MSQAFNLNLLSLLPEDIVREHVLPLLLVRDMQSLDTALTNHSQRPWLRTLWKSFTHNSCAVDDEALWLSSIGAAVVRALVQQPKYTFITKKKAMRYIRSTLPSVKALWLTGNDELYPSELINIAENCPQLEEIYVHNTVHFVGDADLIGLAQHCKNLHSITLWGGNFTERGIQALIMNCQNLKNIDMDLSKISLFKVVKAYPHIEGIAVANLTDNDLLLLAQTCQHLQSLIIKHNTNMGQGLAFLISANKNLVKVDVKCTILDNDLINLTQNCTQLQTLNIGHLENGTDLSIIALTESCPDIAVLTIRQGLKASDASFIAIGTHLHKLKVLQLPPSKSISDTSLEALASGCPQIEVLSIRSNEITDAGIVALAKGCRYLRTADFAMFVPTCDVIAGIIGRLALGFGAICAIAEKCPLIQEIFVSCLKFDNACLHALAQHCKNLRVLLCVDYFPDKVTASALRELLSSSRDLNIIGSCILPEEEFEELCAAFPKQTQELKNAKNTMWRGVV